MDVMLTRLSCDQRSHALSTWLSATDTLFDSVLTRFLSQSSRMDFSRFSIRLPSSTDFFNRAICLVRSSQVPVSGTKINLLPSQSAMQPMATMVKSCWRFLTFIAASFVPVKVKSKLQRRLAACLLDMNIGHAWGRAQFVAHSCQGLTVPRRAG